MTLGEKLKQARADHELTQQAVAQQVAVSRQTISSWETGKSYPDIDSLVTLSNLYGLTLDSLIKEDTGMLDYLRKSEVAVKLRPIRQAMLILNSLFVIILIFFLPSRLGGGILIAAVLANLVGFAYLQKFAEQLSDLPAWEQRWRRGRLPGLLGSLAATGALIATNWWPVSTAVASSLVSVTLVGWLTLLLIWLGHVMGRLKQQEDKVSKPKR
ncbi:helix-turn-helix transcriptional regulator [Levilactobacillus parabrevis]|nr:helix-turn-helix transcriptional regulator [Levilactobacillus parabrevis]